MKNSINRPCILIVDDVPENFIVLEKLLHTFDVDVVKARSGNEALSLTLHNNFALILLDVLMPEMNGYEVADILKKNDKTDDIPIIFLTAMDKSESQEIKGYSKGAVDFMYKPVNEFILKSKINVFLEMYEMKKTIERFMLKKKIEKPHILIVDDNPENLLVLEKLLKNLDLNIIKANSGNEALALTLNIDFALLILDVQMPVMDGYEVAEILKSDEKTANIPIIFVTANGRDDAKVVKGYDRGAVDFIFKPFNDYILISKVRVFIDLYKMKAGLEELVSGRTKELEESNTKLIQEIEKKIQAEDALKVSEEKYRILVENANDAIFVAQDDVIKFQNQKTEELTGYSAKEQIKTPFIDFVHPDDKVKVIDRYKGRLKGEKPVNIYSFKIISKTGLERTVQLNTAMIQWENRPATLNFLRDITQQVELESHLRQAQKMEALGTLAGGIAHDFNNILSPILGYTEMALEMLPEKSEVFSLVQEVMKAGQRTKDLVNQILTFSRQCEQKLQPLKVQMVVKEALKLLRSSIPTTIEIKQNINPACETVLADPTQVHQIMMNLCINAYHAMKEKGGILGVTLKPIDLTYENMPDKINLPPGPYLNLEINDSGCGIPKDILDKIFEPYFTTKSKEEGTGLGLAIVHGIVINLHGEILVNSALGRGTTFNIYLPVIEKTKQALHKSETAPIPMGNEKILLVDDEEKLAQLHKMMVESLGYQVIAMTSSMDALDIFQKTPDEFDLVITDMTMPKMTGKELSSRILNIRSEMPIILCTGYSDMINSEQAKAIGIRGYVMKPVHKWDLANLIRNALDDNKQ